MDPDPASSPVTQLRWHGFTDRGKVRSNNEDSFLCLRFDAQEVQYLGKIGEAEIETHDYIFAVSDGMGGAKAGEVASRIAVEKITRLLPPVFKQAAMGLEAGFSDVLTELFDQIHAALQQMGRSYQECRGMGATLSLCCFLPGRVYWAHIGDSRIYYLPADGGSIVQLTHDDTHVGWLFRNAKINEREARTHPRRNVLQKALGAGHQFVAPQVGSVIYQPGDLLVLCTDGLVDGLHDRRILTNARPLARSAPSENLAQRLVTAAVAESGKDNTTALVIEAL